MCVHPPVSPGGLFTLRPRPRWVDSRSPCWVVEAGVRLDLGTSCLSEAHPLLVVLLLRSEALWGCPLIRISRVSPFGKGLRINVRFASMEGASLSSAPGRGPFNLALHVGCSLTFVSPLPSFRSIILW